MRSCIAIALLAATPPAVAHALKPLRYEDIEIHQVTPLPGGSADTIDLSAFTACTPPSSLFVSIATNVPTLPSDIMSVLRSNPCAFTTGSLASSLSSEWVSYTSAALSWYNINEAAINNQAAALSSFAASVRANPTCASLIALYTCRLGIGNGSCATATSGPSICMAEETSHATGPASGSASHFGSTSPSPVVTVLISASSSSPASGSNPDPGYHLSTSSNSTSAASSQDSASNIQG